MRADEVAFLRAVAAIPPTTQAQYEMRIWPRDLINGPGRPHRKRCWYLLLKWSRKGWYDYGTTLDLGWLTEAGKAAAGTLPDSPDAQGPQSPPSKAV